MGLPWVIAASYNSSKGREYKVPAGTLSYSVIVFLICSVVCYFILFLRRKFVGGELGGPKASAYASAAALVSLWVIYIVLSILKEFENK